MIRVALYAIHGAGRLSGPAQIKQANKEKHMMNIEEKVIACAAEAYSADAAKITANTEVREELSNQSLLLIAFISSIEDAVGVSIDLRDASKLLTIGDFVKKVESMLG